MSKTTKAAEKPHIVQGQIALPPKHVIRFLEEDLAGCHREEYVDALFRLYQRTELEPSESRRFERFIKKNGTPEEQVRLKNIQDC